MHCKLTIGYSTIQAPFAPIKNFGCDLKMLEVLFSNCDEIMNHHKTQLIKTICEALNKITYVYKNQSHLYFDNLLFQIK